MKKISVERREYLKMKAVRRGHGQLAKVHKAQREAEAEAEARREAEARHAAEERKRHNAEERLEAEVARRREAEAGRKATQRVLLQECTDHARTKQVPSKAASRVACTRA